MYFKRKSGSVEPVSPALKGHRPGLAGVADLALMNATVYTADADRSHADAIAISAGKIIYVGPTEGLEAFLGPRTQLMDLKGKMVLPGFHDAHIHAVGGAYFRAQIQLTDVSDSREAILSRVREYVSKHPERPDYFGMGWEYAAFADGPSKEDLDDISPQKPIFLLSCDGHSGWANSAALDLAGIVRETPDPRGGTIEHHPLTGEPTGWLRESPAYKLVMNKLALPSPEMMKRWLLDFFKMLAEEGITSIFVPGAEVLEQEETFALLSELEDEGRLPLRVTAALRCSPLDVFDPVAAIRSLQERYSRRLFRVRGAKLFLDGVLEAHTAWLQKPYADRSGCVGEPVWTRDEFHRIVGSLDEAAIPMHIHAIGDAAVRMALDSLEESSRNGNRYRGRRHTLAHLDLADPADIPRLHLLGVVANFQPTWFAPDAHELAEMSRWLGKERAMSFYRMKSFSRRGVATSCGSDYPVGNARLLSFRPLDGIEMGHTRRPLGDCESVPYQPEERMSRSEMIDGYTIGAAFQMGRDGEAGSIEVGKWADLVVLSRSLLDAPAHEIHKIKVVLTFFEGRKVFEAP